MSLQLIALIFWSPAPVYWHSFLEVNAAWIPLCLFHFYCGPISRFFLLDVSNLTVFYHAGMSSCAKASPPFPALGPSGDVIATSSRPSATQFLSILHFPTLKSPIAVTPPPQPPDAFPGLFSPAPHTAEIGAACCALLHPLTSC